MIKKAELSAYLESANAIRRKIPGPIDTVLILGSGLGSIADAMENAVRIPYSDIANFPKSTVSCHKGELVYGNLGGKALLVMNGRFHYYEGYEMWETAYPIAVFKLLGVKKLIITNAAGGISDKYRLGDLVCIRDHIKLCGDSPLRGTNIPELGPRFVDIQKAYSPALFELAQKKARELGVELKDGVYAYMTGPQFETAAEIQLLRGAGATLVGMSTVPEVIMAAYCQLPVLCISCVTNMAAGVTGTAITEKDVVNVGKTAGAKLQSLLTAVLSAM